MIRIGLRTYQKIRIIEEAAMQHKKVYVFSYKKFWLDSLSENCEQIEYSDIIMYKFFYRLLGEIDNDCAIVINECLRDRNRNNLTYNCLRHYLNQCGNTYVFEYFPFIEDNSDFMSLLDFDTKSIYKGSGFSNELLLEHDILCQNPHIHFEEFTMDLTDDMQKKYEDKKRSLFDNIGDKDPDTIPRDLHVFVGNFKKKSIKDSWDCVARNARLKKDNVCTYKTATPKRSYFLIDFPIRKLEMNDFLKTTGATDLIFINSTLRVDEYYKRKFKEWLDRLEDFYAKAGIYTQDS